MIKIFTCFFIVTSSIFLNAQCDCPPLPDDISGKTVLNVSTVAELQSALQDCNANGGDYTILLEDGIYELTNNLLYISQNMKNLTIRSASGNRDAVVIRGQGMGGNVGYIFNVAASHFTAADITIGWISVHPIQIHAEHNADSCLIQNVRIVNGREQMLKVSGNASPTFSDGGIVQCCLFEFPDGIAYQWYTGGIDAHRAKNWQVRNNTFKHIRSPENNLAEHAIHFWSDSENTLVENNLIINCDRGIGFGLGSKQHFGGIIRNNFVHTSRDVGIGLESSPDTKVYNNTVITENYFNSIEYRFEETTNVHIANNLVNEDIASRNGGTGLVENNYQNTNMDIFVDAANYDYHLNDNITGIVDAGLELTNVNLDYDCHSRNSAGIPDIGADEFDSSISSIRQKETPEYFLYPNPTTGKFSIFSDNLIEMELWTANGLTILKKKPINGLLNMNISNFPKGVYLIVMKFRGTVLMQKIIRV